MLAFCLGNNRCGTPSSLRSKLENVCYNVLESQNSLAIFLLLFGAKRIPDIAESLGKAVRKLRKAQEESDSDHHDQPR